MKPTTELPAASVSYLRAKQAPPPVVIEIDANVGIMQLVRALTPAGLTLSNTPGPDNRLRITLAPSDFLYDESGMVIGRAT